MYVVLRDANHCAFSIVMRTMSAFNFGGTRRHLLPMTFLEEIAEFALWPCAETTIEEKHARVSQLLGNGNIGVVKVSLANRHV